MGQYYQKILTRELSPILSSWGIDRLTKPFYSGRGQILILHRVIPNSDRERIHNHLSLEISPEHLETIFSYFRNKNYDFISLNMLPAWLENNCKTDRKFVIFTFDDGYKDNLVYAYPVFKKHNIPLTIYVTSSFPEKHAIIWWYILEEIILKNREIQYSFPDGSVNFTNLNHQKKEKAFLRIRGLINQLHDKNLKEELSCFFSKFGYHALEYSNEMVLSWEEISELSKDPLVTIGAHTLNHYNLRNLSEEQSLNEILGCKKLLESKIGKKVDHFSYPFGEYGIRELNIVRDCKFLTATTTDNANVFYAHINHLFALPRITINSLTTEKVLNLQVNGFYPAIVHKFRRIVY